MASHAGVACGSVVVLAGGLSGLALGLGPGFLVAIYLKQESIAAWHNPYSNETV